MPKPSKNEKLIKENEWLRQDNQLNKIASRTIINKSINALAEETKQDLNTMSDSVTKKLDDKYFDAVENAENDHQNRCKQSSKNPEMKNRKKIAKES